MNITFLISVPLITYVVSYLYLAYYHGKIVIFNTIIHEGGTYTLLQTMFYASHFLGHVPIYTTLAFLFTGSYICLTDVGRIPYTSKKMSLLVVGLVVLLVSSFFLSLAVFGPEDTFAYMRQQKQGVDIYAHGGSWNLHLTSSMLLFFLVPVYLYVVKKMLKIRINYNPGGLMYISFGILLLFLLTYLFNGMIFNVFKFVWQEPRYLAHSVRELLTFTITYFPIPLYFLLKEQQKTGDQQTKDSSRLISPFIALLAVVFLVGLFYQSYIPLLHGIGDLAQKPYFAKDGILDIPYLLASHYFEHFLDTIYFTLLCLILYGLALHGRLQQIVLRFR